MMKMFTRLFFSVVVAFCSMAAFADQSVFPVAIASSATSCPQSIDHSANKADFCSKDFASGGKVGFPAAVACGCETKSMPKQWCESMQLVYAGMKANYQSMAKCKNDFHGDWLLCACSDPANGGTAPQECKDQWNCYMSGVAGGISDGECFGKTNATACGS